MDSTFKKILLQVGAFAYYAVVIIFSVVSLVLISQENAASKSFLILGYIDIFLTLWTFFLLLRIFKKQELYAIPGFLVVGKISLKSGAKTDLVIRFIVFALITIATLRLVFV
jgi:hypothetical protein